MFPHRVHVVMSSSLAGCAPLANRPEGGLAGVGTGGDAQGGHGRFTGRMIW